MYIDWLSRFRPALFKLNRVSEKILTKSLKFPCLKKTQIEKIPFTQKLSIAKQIWNNSLAEMINDTRLTDYMIFEEIQTFNIDKVLSELSLNNELCDNEEFILKKLFFNIDIPIKLLSENGFKSNFLDRFEKIKQELKNKSKEEIFKSGLDDFNSIKLLLLVEGITEEKLLPVFANYAQKSFKHYGIKLKAIGGKNPILRFYTENKDIFKIPIFILLDADGVDIEANFVSILKPKDTLYLIKSGEIEDTLPKSLILKSLNNYYKNYGSVEQSDLISNEKTTKLLNNLYKEKGFGEFQKAEFAQILADNITGKDDIPDEMLLIFEKIFEKINLNI